MWMHDGLGWGWMVAGWVWMVLFWGSIIGLAAWAISRLTGHRSSSGLTAMDIAKVRYARGEITRQQFEEMKRDLA